jgi:hypothetical protein
MSLPAPSSDATVLITGASSGIGQQLARELHRRGYHTTLVARREDRLTAIARELATHGAHVRPCDLGDPAARERLIAELLESERALIGLCNNAGFGSSGRLWDLDQRRERAQIEVNVIALHELTRGLLPNMVSRGGGAVLNTGSIAGASPLPTMATYSATKAFVNSFSEALHEELRGTGVSCTLLAPGPVRTEWAERAGFGRVERAMGPVVADPQGVAREAIDGMLAGSRVVVPGLAAKALINGWRYAPRALVLPALARVRKLVD